MVRKAGLILVGLIAIALILVGAWNMLVAGWLNYEGYRQIILTVSGFWFGIGLLVWLDRR